MNLVIFHRKEFTTANGVNLLRFALTDMPLADVILENMSQLSCYRCGQAAFAIPDEWKVENGESKTISRLHVPYQDSIPISSDMLSMAEDNATDRNWFVISNGRFAMQVDKELFGQIPANNEADVIAINGRAELLRRHERLRLTTHGKVVGFRRLYSDAIELSSIGRDWPCHLFIKVELFKKLLTDGFLPASFSEFLKRCKSNDLKVQGYNIAANVQDLNTTAGLLGFCRIAIEENKSFRHRCYDLKTASEKVKVVGNVIFGKNVDVDARTVIIGPTIIGSNVKIGEAAVINSSIIGSNTCVPQGQYVNNCLVTDTDFNRDYSAGDISSNPKQRIVAGDGADLYPKENDTYRYWSRFSYARCLKRFVDCVFAIIVLGLFAPVIPFIAIAIKLTSPGPVFYGDKRQGLHGKEFKCLKFRTMVTGAGAIQEKLRYISQVDGPQFKMDNDPRINAVGRFLRETYIDEIPQFFNVLIGQMSVVGPRPSPKSENTLCPSWRDARLSVRPGITGLWQLYRTRQPMKDFQEWILYDTEYVKKLSLKMDLRICWKTAQKLVNDFLNQF